MLIISNGAFKSGSTWLFNLLINILKPLTVPKDYQNPEWINPSIDPAKIHKFLTTENFANHDYISKNHFCKISERELLLSYENVYIFDIVRDLKDVVVSSYFHKCNKENYRGAFHDFYWCYGRDIADNVKKYHHVWGMNSNKIFITSFEKLKGDFTDEIKNIGKFLGKSLTKEEIVQLEEQTDFKKLQAKYNDPLFFRKGKIGDHINYFDSRMLKDIHNIEMNGLNKFEKSKLKTKKILRFVMSSDIPIHIKVNKIQTALNRLSK
jgi:hypothetical protein